MIDLADIYLELMFGELPTADGSAKADMLDVNPRNDRAAAPTAIVKMNPAVTSTSLTCLRTGEPRHSQPIVPCGVDA
jgi:hypothetical protein